LEGLSTLLCALVEPFVLDSDVDCAGALCAVRDGEDVRDRIEAQCIIEVSKNAERVLMEIVVRIQIKGSQVFSKKSVSGFNTNCSKPAARMDGGLAGRPHGASDTVYKGLCNDREFEGALPDGAGCPCGDVERLGWDSVLLADAELRGAVPLIDEVLEGTWAEVRDEVSRDAGSRCRRCRWPPM
jgi:hypothetical protein